MSRRHRNTEVNAPPTSPLQAEPPGVPSTISRVTPRNDWERLLANQGALEQPMSDADLDAYFLSMGHSRETLPRLRQWYDDKCNKLAQQSGGRIHVIGEKPEKSGATFQVYPIPHTRNPRLALRIFDGGMERFHHFVLDFYDLDDEKPVNTPQGYRIVPDSVGPLVELMEHERAGIGSWETAFNVPRHQLLPGEEKFSLPEGSYWRLVFSGTTMLRFAIPTRPDPHAAHYMHPISFQPRRF